MIKSNIIMLLFTFFALPNMVSASQYICPLTGVSASGPRVEEPVKLVDKDKPQTRLQKISKVLSPYRWYRKGKIAAKKGWRQFQKEKEEMGWKRWFIAPFDDSGMSFGWKFYFRSMRVLIDPLLELPPELLHLVRHKIFKGAPVRKRASMFINIPIGVLFYLAVDATVFPAVQKSWIENLTTRLDAGWVATQYVTDWSTTGHMSFSEAGNILINFEKGIFSLDRTILNDRIAQLIDLGVLPRESVTKLADAAIASWDLARKDGKLTDEEIYTEFQKRVKELPFYQALTDQQKVYIDYVLLPTIRVKGKSDIEWLSYVIEPDRRSHLKPSQVKGLESLDRIFANDGGHIPFSAIINSVAETITAKDKISERVSKAKDLGLTELLGDSVYRAEIPAFTGELSMEFPGQPKIQMNDELDRWNVMFSDPRFAVLAQRFRDGQVSQVSALAEFTIQTLAFQQIYDAYDKKLVKKRGGKKFQELTVEDVASYIYGSEEQPAVTMLNRIASFLDTDQFKGVEETQLQALKYALIRIYFDYQVILAKSPSKGPSAYDEMKRMEVEFYALADNGSLDKHLKEIWNIEDFSPLSKGLEVE